MSENDEFVPEEIPGETDQEAGSTPDGDLIESEVGGKEIMAEEPVATQDAHPAASLAETPEGSIPDPEESESVREPSRFQVFLRRVLVWFGIVAAAFLAGYLTFYFVFFSPKVAELETALQEIETFQIDLDSAASQLEALKDADGHRALLQVLVDIYDARLALSQENVVAAKAALTGTSAVLEEIIAEIRAFDSGLAETLPSRLDLIRTNVDRDIETAIADCDQLIADLLDVEQALYP